MNKTQTDNSTAIGAYSLELNTIGTGNVAVGYMTLKTNSTGDKNVAIGTNALKANSIGNSNVAIGNDALLKNQNGNRNIAIGLNSLEAATGLNDNIAIGNNSMLKTDLGDFNTVIGIDALKEDGNWQNVAIGHKSGENTLGNYNTFIGVETAQTSRRRTNTICIGYQADVPNASSSNMAVIGNSDIYEIKSGGGPYNLASVIESTSAGAPSSTANFIGQIYVDKDSSPEVCYMAKNTASSGIAGWVPLNGGGGETLNITGVTAGSYTVASTDAVIGCDTSGGTITINLPAASSSNGRLLRIVDVVGNAGEDSITINADGTDTIKGTGPSFTMNINYESISIISMHSVLSNAWSVI